MKKNSVFKLQMKPVIVLPLVGIVCLMIMLFTWVLHGIFFISNEKPDQKQQSALDRNFPGITIKDINDATMTCYQFNSIDLSADATYNTFIASFKDNETYKEFKRTGKCPAENRM